MTHLDQARAGRVTRVGLMSTGGTMASAPADVNDMTGYTAGIEPRLDAADLIERVKGMGPQAQLFPIPSISSPSHEMDLTMMLDLAQSLAEVLELADVDAVVVSHGTNSIEELALVLAMTLPGTKPIVLTASMRPFTALGSDAPANLLDAVRVAINLSDISSWPIVVMGGRLIPALSVKKGQSWGNDAFRIDEAIGAIDALGRPYFWGVPIPCPVTVAARDIVEIARVDIVATYPGADSTMVESAIQAGARGIVVAGAGAGFVSKGLRDALRTAAYSGIPVCMAYRSDRGFVTPYPEERTEPFLWSGKLSAPQAHIALSLLLSCASDHVSLQDAFDALSILHVTPR